ncbi:MAG: glutamine synthetase III [Oscillospiraceae bacterium]|nr:glutamine synthetase III [Oscillospiraceae bacterium]
MDCLTEFFGCDVFDDRMMKKYLSADVYRSIRKTIDEGEELDLQVANVVADAMKDWAVSKGATHYTHWFQPMTGVTAKKHEGFIEMAPDGGVILEFSGKELVKGEPDASSLPSGGLRATFEARGYTAWDPTSYAFVKDNTLHIPTVFCSYTGEALDKKTPLLRSMEALNREALRVLKVLGTDDVKRVTAVAGAEQEYFLIPEDLFEKREDLKYSGRTLFGAAPPKGQEMEDHYYAEINHGIKTFMEDLDLALWKLGVPAKTEHNEVAPSQHELASIYNTVNVATDQNQIVMEVLKETAQKHGFACLLHEKPFARVNGSGKHDNWSLATDTGINLLAPGDTPYSNMSFLLFLCAVIRAVDEYQDLLRLSVATASNDCRLGGNEAPPAVISVYLGEELTGILDSIEAGVPYESTHEELMRFGSKVLPGFRKDHTDRNRTSPVAFTGNKFEFRMPGSSDSIAGPNIMLNCAVADSLKVFADKLEKAKDVEKAARKLIADTYKAHKRIVFNGNGYGSEWIKEAERRGLSNLSSTPECIPHLLDRKNVDLMKELGVYTETELSSRYEIFLENYCKTVSIEARTMLRMAVSQIIPAVEKYTADLASRAGEKVKLDPELECRFEKDTVRDLSVITDRIYEDSKALSTCMEGVTEEEWEAKAVRIRDTVIPAMEKLRADCDEAETRTSSEYWPMPTYGELLFGTK